MTSVTKCRCLALVALAVLVTADVTRAGADEPLPSQAGLPPELVIPPDPALDDQIARLKSLAEYAAANAPKGGFVATLKGCLAGTKKPPLVNIADLAEHVEDFKGQLVTMEGLYQATDEDQAALRTQGASSYVALAGGTSPTGFGEAGPEDMPVRVEGVVEIAEDRLPLVRAHSLTPAFCLTHIRLGRAYELGKNYEKAMESYQQGVKVGSPQGYEFAAFASCRAAQIAHHQLGDLKKALAQYHRAWSAFTKPQPGGDEYHTWVLAGETWQKQVAREVIAGPLDELQREGFWYKLVDVFTQICGGNPALGLLLLALVTRLAIYPLTKKQFLASRAMQSLQPQIKALQARYKDNKQKFQEEFWKLCKANKVNPLGGCLPLLIQMPILIMIYRGIRAYIVRFDQARFLWVHSLSQPDIILLVAYTLSMIAFQKMTQKADPSAQMNPQQAQQQQMMTWMMPLMFFILFQSFPAAFILYWLGTNLVYFAMQYWVMKTAPVPTAAPAGTASGQSKGASADTASGRDSSGGQDSKALSYEEKKAKAQGKKPRKDDEPSKRKRRR